MQATPMGSDHKPSQRPLATLITLLSGILVAVVRIIPHPANFSPIGALGIFGGARLRSWHAFALPVAVMLVTDLALYCLSGFDFKYSPFHISRSYVYGSFLLYVCIGRLLVNKKSFLWIAGASLVGSLQFFVVTNFCDWLFQPLQGDIPAAFRYSRDWAGLMQCFAAGLPFFRGDVVSEIHAFVMLGDFRFGMLGLVLGDLVFTGLLFGLHAALARRCAPVKPVVLQPTGQ